MRKMFTKCGKYGARKIVTTDGRFDRLSYIYWSMLGRCYNPKVERYKNYGGRGITVCSEWNNLEKVGRSSKGWLSFKQWALSNGYRDYLSIDRIDNNKGYCPENCRWVTAKVQGNNTSRNHYITYKGKTQSLKLWCEELGLNYKAVFARITKLHWTVEKAFETTRNASLKIITYKGKSQSLTDWCKELGLGYDKTQLRLSRGWSVKDSFEKK